MLCSLAKRRVAEFLKPYPESELTHRSIRSVLKALDGNVCYILAEALLMLKRPCATLHEGKFIFRDYLEKFGRGDSHSIMNVDGHCDEYENVAAKALEYSDILSELLYNENCHCDYYND